jgi:hypothetical protein
MIFDVGRGAPRKVLEACMGEAALPTDPTRSILGNLLQVVVVLSWQHDDQLKNGLS